MNISRVVLPLDQYIQNKSSCPLTFEILWRNLKFHSVLIKMIKSHEAFLFIPGSVSVYSSPFFFFLCNLKPKLCW